MHAYLRSLALGLALLLPAGPLREPPERGAACDFRVLNAGNSADIVAGFGGELDLIDSEDGATFVAALRTA